MTELLKGHIYLNAYQRQHKKALAEVLSKQPPMSLSNVTKQYNTACMSPFSETFLSESHREEWVVWKKKREKRQSAQPPMSPAEFHHPSRAPSEPQRGSAQRERIAREAIGLRQWAKPQGLIRLPEDFDRSWRAGGKIEGGENQGS